MIRIDTDSYQILGQKYGLPSQKCGMSGVAGPPCAVCRVHGTKLADSPRIKALRTDKHSQVLAANPHKIENLLALV